MAVRKFVVRVPVEADDDHRGRGLTEAEMRDAAARYVESAFLEGGWDGDVEAAGGPTMALDGEVTAEGSFLSQYVVVTREVRVYQGIYVVEARDPAEAAKAVEGGWGTYDDVVKVAQLTCTEVTSVDVTGVAEAGPSKAEDA
jgi:hypothetical protein